MTITRPGVLSPEEAARLEAQGEPIDRIRRSPQYVHLLELSLKGLGALLWAIAIWQFNRTNNAIEQLQAQSQANTTQMVSVVEGMKTLATRQDSAVAAAQAAVLQFERTEKETRMLEYYLLELDAKFISAGLKPAEQSIAQKLAQKRGQEQRP